MQTAAWLEEQARRLKLEGLQLFQIALAGSSCSFYYDDLKLVMVVQYMEEEE